ncbi:MAG: UvrB/UvrC motif-containing protein [Planctomycetota bacterium]
MKCEIKNCDNEATVHLTEIRDGKKYEMHLCEQCAMEKGLPGKPHFSISDLLAGIASQAQSQRTKRGKETACPVCATMLSQFQSSGRFGCPECYVTFKEDVQGLVEKIHGSSQHVGKVPHRVSSEVALQKNIRQLQIELKRAVRREDYEKAAAIRDQIKLIEEKLNAEKPVSLPESKPLKPTAPLTRHISKKKEKPEGGEKKG